MVLRDGDTKCWLVSLHNSKCRCLLRVTSSPSVHGSKHLHAEALQYSENTCADIGYYLVSLGCIALWLDHFLVPSDLKIT
jgi:hypothetical protein